MIATQRTTFAEIMPPPDDAALVQAAQKDISAFSPLYQRYVQQVYRYLLARVGNAPDAQDLTSQTFMAAMQGLKQYRGQQPFIAWLLGIARHKAADQFRQRRPDVELDVAELLPGSDDALEDQVGRRLEMEQIGRKLQAIAPDRAEALSLRLFAGLEVAEVARIMARNEAAVRMLVFRGLRDLQQQLNVSPEERR
jgi:RNA polymerase sigma-70 factor, ECF subfamily